MAQTRIYQKMNPEVIRKQAEFDYKAIDKLSKPALLLLSDIKKYIAVQYYNYETQRRNKFNAEFNLTVLDGNTLVIDPEYVFRTKIVNPSDYKEIKYANRKARNLVKEIARLGILNSTGIKDDYRLNPLYFYQGHLFADCYELWCEAEGIEPDQKYLKGSRNVKQYFKDSLPSNYEISKDQIELGKNLGIY